MKPRFHLIAVLFATAWPALAQDDVTAPKLLAARGRTLEGLLLTFSELMDPAKAMKGGKAPYTVQKLNGTAWEAAGTSNETTATLPLEGKLGLFRIGSP